MTNGTRARSKGPARPPPRPPRAGRSDVADPPAFWFHSSAVVVADRRKARDWYCDVLGFTVLDDDPEHWTTVGNPSVGARIHLCESARRGKRPGPTESRATGILLLTREPLARVYRRLAKRGVRFPLPPCELPWGSIARFLDPDGNEFWLMPAPDGPPTG
ncbi:MAG: VOC family protein [Thermoplasmata archaeon]|nr:VOC family protein [Thermoplasmata archaeon]